MRGVDQRGEPTAGLTSRRVRSKAIVFIAATLLSGTAGQLAQTCAGPATVDLITGASASDVIGVVEYEVIAESLVGMGASVGATRRIWGGVVADRWMVVTSDTDCPETPVAGLGDHWYLLVRSSAGSGGPVYGLPSSPGLSDLEAGALAAIVGEPVSVDIGSLDRSMAFVRVNWWLIAFGVVAVVAVVAVVQHRSSNSRRDYLF